MKHTLDNCPNCGGQQFLGHQQVRMNVVCDPDGNFFRNIQAGSGIYDAENPYGPFTCLRCKKEYATLPIVVEVETLLEDVVALLESTPSEDVDDLVHDLVSQKASSVNNGGKQEQAKYLLEEFNGDVQALKAALKQ